MQKGLSIRAWLSSLTVGRLLLSRGVPTNRAVPVVLARSIAMLTDLY